MQAPSDQTYKNTLFFDDPVGLSKKMCAGLRRNAKKYEIEFRKEAPTQTVGAKHQKKNNGFSICFMKSLVIPYQSKIRDDKYTLPVKRKELSCADFGIRFWQSPVNALRRKNVLWHRPAGKRFWLLRARPANLRKFVRLKFHRGPNPRNGNVFKCTLSYLGRWISKSS